MEASPASVNVNNGWISVDGKPTYRLKFRLDVREAARAIKNGAALVFVPHWDEALLLHWAAVPDMAPSSRRLDAIEHWLTDWAQEQTQSEPLPYVYSQWHASDGRRAVVLEPDD